jgi:hypothetical protein
LIRRGDRHGYSRSNGPSVHRKGPQLRPIERIPKCRRRRCRLPIPARPETDDVAVHVFVSRKYPASALPYWAHLPEVVAADEPGHAVGIDVIDVGFVYGFQDTTRYRPVPGGCSIGHQSLNDAGTLGGWAGDNVDDTFVFLSCNHVLANIDVAPPANGVSQPGRLDGGVFPADQIGTLKRFSPIAITGTPLPTSPVDAAIGTITVGRDDNVLQIGPAIYETAAPVLNMTVQKRGRTTRLTTNGTIDSVNVTLNVNYNKITAGGGTTAVVGRVGNTFRVTWPANQGAFGQPGDSGSLIFSRNAGQLNGTFPVVGMLFAGTTSNIWGNNIANVLNTMNITTVCSKAVEILIDAIFGAGAAAAGSSATGRDAKVRQLRMLRDRVLAATSAGRDLTNLAESETARLFSAVLNDDDAFGLAVKTLDPWIRHATNYDILEATLDEETIHWFGRFAERVGEIEPDLRNTLSTARDVLVPLQGSRVRDILQVAKLLDAAVAPGKPTRRRRSAK